KKVYEHLAYYYQIAIGFGYNKTFEFNIDKFCHIFKYFPIQVEAALRILDKAGYIEYMEEQDNSARVMFTLERDELYRLKNNSPTEEKVVVALLRNYSGLFCDYNYIDESFIASQCGLTSSPEDLEDLTRMWACYHDDLEGNGYLDSLMAAVKRLPIA
ncbi:MAG: hypothetical protein II229_03355, partial [Clostridia bacterium]|nr:hypothetical protein [Clostridia bacterium]